MTCIECEKEFEFKSSIDYKCPECKGLLWFKADINSIKEKFPPIKIVNNIWDYRFAFPPISSDFHITLGEGGTPCLISKKFGEKLGIENLYFKDESHNPTNSFKDRCAALLISHARSWDFKKFICASNGNQGASIAAYTSLEGMECLNIIPEKIDVGKKAQMIAYNSNLKIIGDTVDDAIDYILEQKDLTEYYQCTPELNPLTLEAQKTIAYEIINQIGKPDLVIIPMGSGELLVSLWKGFNELINAGVISNIPKLVGVQSQVSSPIVNEFLEFEDNNPTNKEIHNSLALGILVKNPLYKELAIKCIKESKGTGIAVPEDLILTSIDELIRNEGIFAEPASALAFGAIRILQQKKIFKAQEKIVCLITASGLKAPYVLEAISSQTKTTGKGSIIITKLKILSQISLTSIKGITGTKIKETMESITLAAIYQHLKELETKGLISRKKEGKKVLYFITDSGKKVLDALDVLITLL
ncbi:MAG: pyridoxal-phosphate dependent enzyme [Candidatus Lokiarchaeota archaeon]|nr:pyridoxal-phosphate dependent enzyme [Candidatus Lokiarchaeota archaeon]